MLLVLIPPLIIDKVDDESSMIIDPLCVIGGCGSGKNKKSSPMIFLSRCHSGNNNRTYSVCKDHRGIPW